MTDPVVFCTYEDRPQHIGLRLLLLSLARRAPWARVLFFAPAIPDDLRAWFAQAAPNTEIHAFPPDEGSGWNVKPSVMLKALQLAGGRVAWIDDDIIVGRDPRRVFEGLADDTLLAAQTIGVFNPKVVTAWGDTVGRPPAFRVNSCVVSATAAHTALLEAWRARLRDERYLAAQKAPMRERPKELYGDQNVLEGLLAAGFDGVPVRPVRFPDEVAHMTSAYSVRLRLRRGRGAMPCFVHAQGIKPWNLSHIAERSRVVDAESELSLYTHVARAYREELAGTDTSWLEMRTGRARLCSALALGNPHWRAVPLMMMRQLGIWR